MKVIKNKATLLSLVVAGLFAMSAMAAAPPQVSDKMEVESAYVQSAPAVGVAIAVASRVTASKAINVAMYRLDEPIVKYGHTADSMVAVLNMREDRVASWRTRQFRT